ncbi:MAG TPA: Rv3235 family protein [Jatrophihabitantaceae bacterium]|jgi:hypothetical protein
MTTAVVRNPQPAEGRAFVIRPAPHREPPFDDELPAPHLPIGPFDQALPFERPPRHRIAQPAVPSMARSALPDPAQWGRRLLVGVIETTAGRRPLNQLTSLVSPAVALGMRGDFERAARRGRPHWMHRANVRTVRSSQPSENVAELSATVGVGERVRAIAMRLEVRHGRWCCTKLMLG